MKRWLAAGCFVMLVGAFTTARADDGPTMFAKKCASCHGKDGKGQTKMGEKLKIKDLTDAKVQGDFTDAKAVTDVTNGVKDKDTGKDRMPAFKDKLTGDQIKEIVSYVRTLKGT